MLGSSPLARGLQSKMNANIAAKRIIPARAGFTVVMIGFMVVSPDHPRSRGVYHARTSCGWQPRGSSPLARGLRAAIGTMVTHTRIIPARAGFTVGGGAFPLPCRDHPRSRGVYETLGQEHDGEAGSSPLARGLLEIDDAGQEGDRIIPARAGFTWIPVHSRSAPKDHPRSRGVYITGLTTEIPQVGSSPLARGLRHIRQTQGQAERIIPARAGFTAITEAFRGFLEDHPRSRGVYGAGSDSPP